MNRILSGILFFILPLSALAQSEEAGFTADRPGATNSVDVLPKGRLQWETGVGFLRNKEDDFKDDIWTLNTSLLRLGISDYAELRLQGSWLKSDGDFSNDNSLADVAIGTKVRLFDGWRFVPTIALLGNVYIPSKHFDLMPDNWSGQLSLAFQNELTSWLSLSYETNLTWLDSERPIYFYGACLNFTLGDSWLLLLEEYNENTTEGTDSWIEVGAAYQLTKRLQLDVSTDIYLNYPKNFWNLNVGVSWQITKK